MFAEATSQRDIATIARLAREIWREHYTPIIGAEQVAYMLEKFQSAAAIAAQLAQPGHWYFIIRERRRAVGYIGLERRGRALFLSKLYLAKSVRRRGFGRLAVAFIFDFAAARGLSVVRLTVNRHNAAAIAAYERTGFAFAGEQVTDIGGGYVMDDFVFERKIPPRPRRKTAPSNIRDAASLILVRESRGGPRVLLGRRASSNRFMPGMYVFPGGILQPADYHAAAGGELHASCAALMGVRGNAGKAAALAKTAIRETAEETGLMLGRRGDVGAVSDCGWRALKAAGLQPDLRGMTYLGRAITPVGMPLRFNARFFIAAATAARGALADSDELGDLRWVKPREWRELPMVDITIYLLNHFEQIRRRARRRQCFVFRHHRGRAHIRWQSQTANPKLP